MKYFDDGLLLVKRSLYLCISLTVLFVLSATFIVTSQKPIAVETTTLASIYPFPTGTTAEQADAYSERLKKIDSLVQYFSQSEIQQSYLETQEISLPENVSITFSANATTGFVVIRVEGPLVNQQEIQLISDEIVNTFLSVNSQIESKIIGPGSEKLDFTNQGTSLSISGQVSKAIWIGAVLLAIFSGISATFLIDIFRRRLLYSFQRDSFARTSSIPYIYLGKDLDSVKKYISDELKVIWSGSKILAQTRDIFITAETNNPNIERTLELLLSSLEINPTQCIDLRKSDLISALTSSKAFEQEPLGENSKNANGQTIENNGNHSFPRPIIYIVNPDLESCIEIANRNYKGFWVEIIDSVSTNQSILERRIALINRLGIRPDIFVYS